MATKKAAAKKTSTTAKKAPSKPATTTKIKTTTASSSSAAVVAAPVKRSAKLDSNVINIVLAELVGTFVLVMVALLSFKEIMPLYVGLTVAVLVLAVGAVSGSHLNPAVTFGLWSVKKVKALLVPFYWGAQFLGAMAAVVALNAIAGSKQALDFSHFTEFSWPIFLVELVATAVFLFGLTSIVNRTDVSNGQKALGIGLSLAIGILVSTSLMTTVQKQAFADYRKNAQDAKDEKGPAIPHTIYVQGATLNPAVALAATEATESELRNTTAADDEKRYSRLGIEVIFATLIGAALGANLARLMAHRFKS